MANVSVTYQEMTAAGDRLRAGRAEIETQLQQLQRLVEGLVAGGYVTDASSKAFSGAYDEFTTGVRQTVLGLDGMADYLRAAAQAFEDADTQLAGQLRR
jgi:WXG100 family type VII secretion target